MKKVEKTLQKGMLWSVIQVLTKRVFDFFVKLVLLNTLFPEDFGLVSMATAFTSIVFVFSDFGFKNALVQRKDVHLDDLHYQSVFWFGIAWAILIYLVVIFFGTDILSAFYDETILLKIVPILSIPILIDAVTLVYRVKLFRYLQFKKLAILQSVAIILSGLAAVIFALKGAGIWSLVLYITLPYFFSLPFYLLLTKWRPVFSFSFSHLKEIMSFSIFTFLTAFIVILSCNLDLLFIGKLTGAKSLGIYSFAIMFTLLLSVQITSMIDRVLYPFYSKVQNNLQMVKSYFLKSLSYYAIILYPIMLGLILFSSPVIKLFFNEKWLDANFSIKVLAFAVLVKLLTHGSTMVYRSMGRPKLEMQILSFSLIFTTFPAIYIGSHFGINGVSKAVFVATVINMFIYFYFLNRELSLSPIDVLDKLKAPILGFVICFLVIAPTYYFTKINFIILIFLMFAIYSSVIYYFHSNLIKKLIKLIFKS